MGGQGSTEAIIKENEARNATAAASAPQVRHQLDQDASRVKQEVYQQKRVTSDVAADYRKQKDVEIKQRLKDMRQKIVNDDVYNHYDEIEYLGGGGYSDVYEMEPFDKDGKTYAVKIMKETRPLESDAETINEISLMLAAQHPHMVSVKEVYEMPGQPMALVMEIVKPDPQYPGQPPDLMTVLMEKGPLDMQSIAKVIYHTAEAIDFLNTTLNAFHRDLKPDNILIGEAGFDGMRVADFGHGRVVEEGASDNDVIGTMNKGTTGYNAPEMISTDGHGGYGEYNKQVDVWSLGVIAYMCVSATPPFPISPARAQEARRLTLAGDFKPMSGRVWDQCDPQLKALICRMMTVNPQRRISMRELLSDPWVLNNM